MKKRNLKNKKDKKPAASTRQKKEEANAAPEPLVLPPANVPNDHKFTYDVTHKRIKDFLFEHLKGSARIPTQSEIADKLGLARETITRHWKELRFQNFLVEEYKSYTPLVMQGLLRMAMSGRPAAVKLWFQIVEGWRAPIEEVKIMTPEEEAKAAIITSLLSMTPEQRRERLIQLRERRNESTQS